MSEDELNRRNERIRDLQAENEKQQEEIARLRQQNARLRETTRGRSHDDLVEKLRLVTEERDKLKKHLHRAHKFVQTLLANNVWGPLTVLLRANKMLLAVPG